MTNIEQGFDAFKSDEVDYTLKIVDIIKSQGKDNWMNKMLNDSKITKVLNSVKEAKAMKLNEEKEAKAMNPDEKKEAKTMLSEIRFAHALNGYSANYEYKTGVGKTSVDFFIPRKNGTHNFLIELTSSREGEHIKQNILQKNGITSYVSPDNNTEVKEILRLQQTILSKVAKQSLKFSPIKFPMPDGNTYNAIICDTSSVLGGIDENDFKLAMYGNEYFKDPIYHRYFIDEKGTKKPILGICDQRYYCERAKHFRKTIHIVGIYTEENYEKGEINSNIQSLCNPHLIPELDLKLPIEK